MSFGTLFCPKLPTHVHWTYPPVAISIWELLEKPGLFNLKMITALQPPGYKKKPLFTHSLRSFVTAWCSLVGCADSRSAVWEDLVMPGFSPGDFMSIPSVRKVNCDELRHVAKSQSSKHPISGWCPTCQLIFVWAATLIKLHKVANCSHH